MPRTIKTLCLNLREAQAGRTWLLLPEQARSQKLAHEWPLPEDLQELKILASILIPPRKQDAGCIYLKRAAAEWRRIMMAKGGSIDDIERSAEEARARKTAFAARLSVLEERALRSVEGVQSRAAEAVASLDSLFELGRAGLEGQMRAHIEGAKWHGEGISAAAFRQCFFMVAKTVKGLGLPSEERGAAREVVMKEVASSLRASQMAAVQEEGKQN